MRPSPSSEKPPNHFEAAPTKQSTTPDLLSGPVGSLFIRMSMPIILGLLVNGLFNFVDAIFISQAVGTDAIGGVSAAFPIHMMMISISAMLGAGMASILSRMLGAGLDKQANKVFSASMVLAGLVGLLISVVVVIFRYEIFIFSHLPSALLPFAVEYITPIAMFSVVSFLYGSLSEAFRAEGQNMQVMKLMAVSAILNVFLDALFLFVFEWGVAGAAGLQLSPLVPHLCMPCSSCMETRTVLNLRSRTFALINIFTKKLYYWECRYFYLIQVSP